MRRWPKDNQAALIKYYGTPGRDVASQLVKVVPPFKMYYGGKQVKAVSFHKKAAPALKVVLNEIWDHYEHDQKRIDAAGVSKYAGTYNPRMVRGSSTKWSNHAFGAAIDLNAEQNGMGTKGNMPKPVVAAFKRQGFRWGGDYKGRKDPMHFEACGDGEAGPALVKPKPAVVPLPKPKPKPEVIAVGPPVDHHDNDNEPATEPEVKEPVTEPVTEPDRHDNDNEPAEVPAEKVAPVVQVGIVDPVTVKAVQERLRDLKYFEVGTPDGVADGRTKDAIRAFRLRNELPDTPDIDKDFLASLFTSTAKPREIAEARANTTSAELAPTNTTVKASVWNKLTAMWSGVGLFFAGVANYFKDAWESMGWLRDGIESIPIYIWLGGAFAIALAVYLNSRRAEKDTVDAFKKGQLL